MQGETCQNRLCHLQDTGASAQRGHAGGGGLQQQRARVVRLQAAAQLPREPEGRQLGDGQHLRGRAEGVPAHMRAHAARMLGRDTSPALPTRQYC